MLLRRWTLLPLILLTLTGCAETPEDTIRSFVRAVERGDADEAISYTSAQMRMILPAEKVKAAMREGAEQYKKCGGIDAIDVTLTGEGDIRSGSYKITFHGSCPAEENDVKLVKEEGGWKIAPNK